MLRFPLGQNAAQLGGTHYVAVQAVKEIDRFLIALHDANYRDAASARLYIREQCERLRTQIQGAEHLLAQARRKFHPGIPAMCGVSKPSFHELVGDLGTTLLWRVWAAIEAGKPASGRADVHKPSLMAFNEKQLRESFLPMETILDESKGAFDAQFLLNALNEETQLAKQFIQTQVAKSPTTKASTATQPASGPQANDVVNQTAGVEARAIGVLAAHNEWTNKQIADAVGTNAKYLSSLPKFKAARTAIKAAGKSAALRGSKSKEGDLEAWDEG